MITYRNKPLMPYFGGASSVFQLPTSHLPPPISLYLLIRSGSNFEHRYGWRLLSVNCNPPPLPSHVQQNVHSCGKWYCHMCRGSQHYNVYHFDSPIPKGTMDVIGTCVRHLPHPFIRLSSSANAKMHPHRTVPMFFRTWSKHHLPNWNEMKLAEV